MKKYIAFDLNEIEYDFFENEVDAENWCNERIDMYRDDSNSQGWEEIEFSIGYAELKQMSKEKIIAEKDDYSDIEWEEEGYSLKFDKICDYELSDEFLKD